jgi:hypothetical protein
VAVRVLEQVTNHAAQESRVATHDGGLSRNFGAHTRGLLGSDGEQIHRLHGRGRRTRVETRREEKVLDQRIQLADVLFGFGTEVGAAFGSEQLNSDPKASEGGAKLMRGAREHAALSVHQFLNPICRLVEAASQVCDLVPPLYGDSRRKMTCA